MAIDAQVREFSLPKAVAAVHSEALQLIAQLNGDVDNATDTYIEAEFGSKGKTVALPGSQTKDWPRKLELYLTPSGETTNVKLTVRSTHSMGSVGIQGKIERELGVFADQVVTQLVM